MPHNSTQWGVEVYETALSFDKPQEYEGSPVPPDRERGDISSFSSASRRRLIKKMLRLERSRLSDGMFLTLTYHEQWPEDRAALKRQLNAFLQACRRRWPGLHYLWRVELQKRGAPHFHLILWRSRGETWEHTDDIYRWAVDTWQRVSGCTTEAHARHGVDLQELTSWREALAYTSKYVAKMDSGEKDANLGRRWATSEGLPCSPHIRLHINERAGHILRRLCRKLMSSRTEGESSFADHLREAPSALVGMDPDSVDKMLNYLARREDCLVRQGPGPPPHSSVPSDLSERLRRQRERRRQQWNDLSWREEQGHCGSYDTESGPSALHRAAPDVLVQSWG